MAVIDTWNANNFPLRARFIGKELVIEKYMLDNLIGSINLDEAPIITVLSISGKNDIDCANVLHKLKIAI